MTTANLTDLLKEILTRLAQRRLAPTPENFATAYYEVARERGLSHDEAEAPDLDCLLKLSEGLDGLLAENPELERWRQSLRSTLLEPISPVERRLRVKQLVAELWRDRSRLLYDVGGATIKLRESVRGAAREMQELAHQLGRSDANLGRIMNELDECVTLDDARRLLDEARTEMAGMHEVIARTKAHVSQAFAEADPQTVGEAADELEKAYLHSPLELNNLLSFSVSDPNHIRVVANQIRRSAPDALVGKLGPHRGIALFGQNRLTALLEAIHDLKERHPELRFGSARLPEQKSVDALRTGLSRAIALLQS